MDFTILRTLDDISGVAVRRESGILTFPRNRVLFRVKLKRDKHIMGINSVILINWRYDKGIFFYNDSEDPGLESAMANIVPVWP